MKELCFNKLTDIVENYIENFEDEFNTSDYFIRDTLYGIKIDLIREIKDKLTEGFNHVSYQLESGELTVNEVNDALFKLINKL